MLLKDVRAHPNIVRHAKHRSQRSTKAVSKSECMTPSGCMRPSRTSCISMWCSSAELRAFHLVVGHVSPPQHSWQPKPPAHTRLDSRLTLRGSPKSLRCWRAAFFESWDVSVSGCARVCGSLTTSWMPRHTQSRTVNSDCTSQLGGEISRVMESGIGSSWSLIDASHAVAAQWPPFWNGQCIRSYT